MIIRAWLGGEQGIVDLRSLADIRRSPPELLPIRLLPLTEQQIVRLPLHLLARGENQLLSARATRANLAYWTEVAGGDAEPRVN